MARTHVRMDPTDRNKQIEQTAFRLAVEHGLRALTRVMIAEHAECSVGLVSHYMGNIEEIRGNVIQRAAKSGPKSIVKNAQDMGYDV